MISASPTKLPAQRWQIATAQPELAQQIAQATDLSLLVAQVLLNRGITTPEQAQIFLNPDIEELPSPLTEFPDLPLSLELLINAINCRSRIAICGDYDADGMTSTALLLRALRFLGGQVDYAIPSRMKEGYGINQRMVEEFHDEGVEVILTVDNGIAAYAPIARARELGLTVIVTDHHDLPPELPPANAILNPKLISETSPYRGMAGVGVAYVLAVFLANSFNRPELNETLLELFTLGTIADLAPLTGVNRRWVKQGLQLLPHSKLEGVQALIQVSGLSGSKELKPEAIGFRLGPRINAVGRIADPQVVIDLLTTDDPGVALERAMQCEQINRQRQLYCEEIEQEAIALSETFDVQGDRVLVVINPGWHHGVIGIVASRLVERYGVPVFIGTNEDDGHIRGSARGIPEFHVFEALEFCKDLLEKHGGHKAAGGFSLKVENLPDFRLRLRTFAHQHLDPELLKPLVTIDAESPLAEADFSLFHQLDVLHPCGIDNPEPVFWSANVRVWEQRKIGKGHVKLTVSQAGASGQQKLPVIGWRWGDYYPLPSHLDIAYRLRLNEWNGAVEIQLELVGARPATQLTPQLKPDSPQAESKVQTEFSYNDRRYCGSLLKFPQSRELRIRNAQGHLLTVQQGCKMGTLTTSAADSKSVDVSQPHYYHLIKAALAALEQVQG